MEENAVPTQIAIDPAHIRQTFPDFIKRRFIEVEQFCSQVTRRGRKYHGARPASEISP